MKKKISTILGVALAVVLVLTLGAAFVAPAAQADAGAWTKFPTPRPGSLNDYLLTTTDNTTIANPVDPIGSPAGGPGPLVKSPVDGALYAFWKVGEPSDVYKSTDNGRSWTRLGKGTGDPIQDADYIIDIACSREDADLVYALGSDNSVYRTDDGGGTWSTLSDITDTTGYETLKGEWATCIDAGYDGSSHWVVVGTKTVSAGALYGDVYIKQDPYLGPWMAQSLTANRSVIDVACAPDFAERNQLVIAVTDNGTTVDDGCTLVTYQYGGGGWTHETEIKWNDSTTTTACTGGNITSADIAFPSDFTSTWSAAPDYFVGINTAYTGGDVYHVIAGTVLDCDIDGSLSATNVRSIALVGETGDTKLLVGTADEADVYHSEDNGDTWYDSKYDPSGNYYNAYVEVADDYYDSGIGWAAVGGFEGALSQTKNYGVHWYQISLINTDIYRIKDLAFSPAYAEDSTMFMVTDNQTYVSHADSVSTSVWRHDGTYWERVCDNVTQSLTTLDDVKVSPKYATDSAVFIRDKTGKKFWRSTDGGYRFKKQAGAPAAVGTGWLVIDSSTLIVSDSGDECSLSTNNGVTWSDKVITGASDPSSFALSPDYDNDSTIIMGDSDDGVFISTDGGVIWAQVPAGVDTESGAGTCYVACDTNYATNDTIYAGGGTSQDVYRLVVGTDTSWKTIDAAAAVTWPGASDGANDIDAIATGNGGVYVTDNNTYAVLRSINPTLSYLSSRGVYFEAMKSGWVPAASATGLWLAEGESSNVLWTIRGTAEIYTYEDELVVGPTLAGPEEGFSTGRENEAVLSWEALPMAKYYFVWVSTSEDFAISSIQSSALASTSYPWNATSSTTSFKVTGLSSGKTYYWKVAVADSQWGNHSSASKYASSTLGRALSPWSSEVRSFSTGIAGGEWNPFRTPEGFAGNVAPIPGASDVPLKPAFQFNAADWATGYEFVLADNSDYTSPVVETTLTTTTYALGEDLSYSTSYYWKVRAVSETTESKWGEGVFTTMAKPAEPTPPVVIPPAEVPAPIAPTYIWAIIGIGAILVIAVIVLIVRTRRVA